jgi:hypothetical protein
MVAWWALGTKRTCWRMDSDEKTPKRSSNDETITEEKSNDGATASTWMNGMEESNTVCPGTKMEGGAVNISAISHCSDENIIFVFFVVFLTNKDDDNDFPQLSQSATVPANAAAITWMNFMALFLLALVFLLGGFAIGGVCLFFCESVLVVVVAVAVGIPAPVSVADVVNPRMNESRFSIAQLKSQG